jgi:hypothetical protein
MAVLELVDHPEIDRKRKPKTESAEDAAAKAEKQAAKPTDPFGKFRKLFSPKTKVKGSAGVAKTKSAAGRKSPAGGGSSKSGGSSS